MKVIKRGGKEHKVYERYDALPAVIEFNLVYWEDRVLEEGDWVIGNDGSVQQVLHSGILKKPGRFGKHASSKVIRYIRTCTGIYIQNNGHKLTSISQRNPYSFSTKTTNEITAAANKRSTLTAAERRFVRRLWEGDTNQAAYLTAFFTKNEEYALRKGNVLAKSERVDMAMRKDLEPIMAKHGLDANFFFKNIKELALEAETDNVKFQALKEIGKILGMEEKEPNEADNKDKWLGFQDPVVEKILSTERPLLKESQIQDGKEDTM